MEWPGFRASGGAFLGYDIGRRQVDDGLLGVQGQSEQESQGQFEHRFWDG